MYAQCDVEGNEYMLLDSFIDYRKLDDALSKQEQKYVKNDRLYYRKSTAGWEI